jgi:hypothetical protein
MSAHVLASRACPFRSLEACRAAAVRAYSSSRPQRGLVCVFRQSGGESWPCAVKMSFSRSSNWLPFGRSRPSSLSPCSSKVIDLYMAQHVWMPVWRQSGTDEAKSTSPTALLPGSETSSTSPSRKSRSHALAESGRRQAWCKAKISSVTAFDVQRFGEVACWIVAFVQGA